MIVQVLKKCDNWDRRTGLATSVKEKNKIHLLGRCWEWQTTSLIAFILARWLMLARKLCVYSAGLKVDVTREIWTVVMTSYYKNACSCKRHTVVCRAHFIFGNLLCFFGLATHYHESWCFFIIIIYRLILIKIYIRNWCQVQCPNSHDVMLRCFYLHVIWHNKTAFGIIKIID